MSILHKRRIHNVPTTALQWKMTKTVSLFTETIFFFAAYMGWAKMGGGGGGHHVNWYLFLSALLSDSVNC